MPDEPTPGAEVLRHRPMRWLRPAALVGAGIAALVVVGGLVGRGMASQSLKSWTDAEAIPTVSVIRPDAARGRPDPWCCRARCRRSRRRSSAPASMAI